MIAWLKRILHMSDTDANGSPVIAEDVPTPVAASAVEVDFDKLKALLIAYGHAIGSEYDQFVALLKK